MELKIRASTFKSGWVVCIDNADHPVFLERGKLYRRVVDRAAAEEGFVRMVDESGKDYLYPSEMLEPITLPYKIRRALSPKKRISRQRAGRNLTARK